MGATAAPPATVMATDPIEREADLPLWDVLKTEADGSPIVFGAPLTEAPINDLTDN